MEETGKKRSLRERVVFPILAIVLAFIVVESVASFALLLRYRITGSQKFTATEPTYLSLVNIPFKAGVLAGLFDGIGRVSTEIDPRPLSSPDPELGYKPNLGKFVYTYSRGGSNPKTLRVSMTRLRDGTRWTGEPGNGPTVYIFGDSFVAGEGVNDEQTFSYLLQQARKDLNVKLYAVGGYGMTQSYILFNRLRDQIRPDDIVILGYADFYDMRNVAAPSRLRETHAADGVMLPKAEIGSDGEIRLSYVQQRCSENNGYCDQPDPPREEMTRVSAALINAVTAGTEAKVYLLHFDGERDNPVRTLIDNSVALISALPKDFDFWIRDDVGGLDSHPGPYWHYAISRKLIEAL